MPNGKENVLPSVNPRVFYQMLLNGQIDKICDAIIKVLCHYEMNNYTNLDAKAVSNINDFVSVVLALMADPDFKIENEAKALQLVSKAHIFANVVRISSYNSTDSVLAHILNQQGNFIKLLFLCTSRNMVRLPVKRLFDTNPKFASLWYFTYILPSIGQINPVVHENLVRHIEEMDERYTLFDRRLTPLYFACTYINDNANGDKRVKRIVNRCAQILTKHIDVKNTPKRDSIAIVTAKWFENSAVYKSSAPLIERLRKDYKLTLVHLGTNIPETLITEPFDEVRYVSFDDGHSLTIQALDDNDFQVAYYPDIGMNDESVWLSNLRIAPIQVTSYGHPVSTYGSEIDYFIVGSDSEDLPNLASNYSERPVVIPGIGAHPTWPNYEAKYPEKNSDKTIINCVWGPDKYNWPTIQLMQQVVEASERPIEFHVYCSMGVHRYQGYMPFVVDLKKSLGDSVVVHADKEYFDYMESAEQADFAINSWPFGGYNTVVESLYLRKPMVTMEGDKFYNKAAACLLRKVGLWHLVAESPEEFVAITARLANDQDFLDECVRRLTTIDLKATLFDTDEPGYFQDAIEYLIENHEDLKNRPAGEPVMIGSQA
jgi:predicted O-linked N-acetylglucosamine transferase (SPINDLY family)